MSALPNIGPAGVTEYQSPYYTLQPINSAATAESIQSNPTGWALSLVPIPAAIFLILLIYLLAYSISSCVRSAKSCCDCCHPKYTTTERGAPKFVGGLSTIATFVVLAAIFTLIYFTRLTTDVTSVDNSMTDISNYQKKLQKTTSTSLEMIHNTNSSLVVLEEQIQQTSPGFAASQVAEIQSQINEAQSQVQSVQSTVDSDLHLDTAHNDAQTTETDMTAISYSMFFITLILMGVPFALVVIYTRDRKASKKPLTCCPDACVNISEALSTILNFLMAALVGIGFMVTSFAINDACIIGIPSIINQFVNSTDLNYYISNTIPANETNPFFPQINQTVASLDIAIDQTKQIETQANTSGFTNIYNAALGVQSNLTLLRDFVAVDFTALFNRDQIHPIVASLENTLCQPLRSDLLLFAICLIFLFVIMTIFFIIVHIRPVRISHEEEAKMLKEEEASKNQIQTKDRHTEKKKMKKKKHDNYYHEPHSEGDDDDDGSDSDDSERERELDSG